MISVIIPVFNRTEELKRAVKSAMQQTIRDIEIIVVDDFSEADIKSAVDSLEDTRIVFIRLPAKGNANVCRNEGLRLAKGEFCAMLDSDDEWLPDHLEKKLNSLKELKVEGVFSGFLVDDGIIRKRRNVRPKGDDEDMANYILDGNTTATPTHLYYTRCAREILWDENFLRHQDWDFSIRFARRYKFEPEFNLTCIVHWRKDEKRTEHLPSQRRFLELYGKSVSTRLFYRYSRDVYSTIRPREDVDARLKEFFRRNFRKNPELISLNDYLGVYRGKHGVISRFLLRVKFALMVFFS